MHLREPETYWRLGRIALIAPILLLVTAFAPVYAQEYRGLILGRVTDPSGAVIPGALITAKGPQQTYTVNTNASGDFTIPFVQPGTYDVTAEATGFKKELRAGVVIDVSHKINLNFSLQVGSVAEEVTVAADSVLLNTADASGGTVIDSEKVQNLPLNGRQIYMLLLAQPGVRFTANVGGVTGQSGTRGWDTTNAYVINGVTTAYNQFTLNGAPISQQTSTAIGAWFVAPNVDAVQELKIMTNTYDASYGRAGGGTVNIITKSGSNDFHGTVFDFWKNSVLEANYFQLKQVGKDRPFHNQHQFGGTFGGPIRKNKTFAFFSFEGWREAFPAGVITSTPAADVRVRPDGSVDFSAYVRQPNSNGIYDPLTFAATNAHGT